MADYYVRRGARILGPVPPENLRKLAASGKVLASDELAQKPDGPWLPFARVKRLLLAPEAPSVAAPPSSGDHSPLPIADPASQGPVTHRPPRVSIRMMSQARMAINELSKRRQERQVETLRGDASQLQTSEQESPTSAAATLRNGFAQSTVQNVPATKTPERATRNRSVAILLALFLGPIAVHRMYLREPWAGRLLIACTGVGLVVTATWGVLDAIRLLRMSPTTFAEQYQD